MYTLLKPLLFSLDPEKAHALTMRAARLGQATMRPLMAQMFRFEHDALVQQIGGITFENPIGLAAGFDKNARYIDFWHTLGFGFCEVGSVTALASNGNPKPRLFRLPQDEALINRMGLNNEGAVAIQQRLAAIPTRKLPLGINLAKTHSPQILGQAAIEDFCNSYALMSPHADYIALNISCPNTEEGKTFEEPEALNALLEAIRGISDASTLAKSTKPPLFVKLSPPTDARHLDTGFYRELLAIIQTYQVNGLICTNTASDRQGLTIDASQITQIGRGGLSGKPLKSRSDALIRFCYTETGGKLPIIGVGGVDSVEAAYHKIAAGASLVQLYTGLVYQGAGLIKRINQGLVAWLEANRFSNLQEAVGSA